MKTIFNQNRALAIFNCNSFTETSSKVRCHLYLMGKELNYESSFLINDKNICAEDITTFSIKNNIITLTAISKNKERNYTINIVNGELLELEIINLKNTTLDSEMNINFFNITERISSYFKLPRPLSVS